MNKVHMELAGLKFVWSYDDQIGKLLPDENVDTTSIYDDGYFDKYQSYEGTRIAERLTVFRENLVYSYVDTEDCLEIGVGSGLFVRESGCMGNDIMPKAIDHLKSIGKYYDVNTKSRKFKAVCFWDSIEHVPSVTDITNMLDHAEEYVFMSVPVMDHSLTSNLHKLVEWKHFRPNEHVWYFSIRGVIRFMEMAGFDVIEVSREEEDIGREDVATFVFKRV
jgi:hypothetical protein